MPFIFLTLIPSVILTLYPTRIYSRYISRCLSARIRLAITTFAEALHSFFMISSSLLVAHVRPCRSWVANFSISFNVSVIGIICIAHYLWEFQLSLSTHTLELTFIIIPLLPHIVVLVWTGYKVICCINSSGCRLPLRLANFACGVRRQHYYGYHPLE